MVVHTACKHEESVHSSRMRHHGRPHKGVRSARTQCAIVSPSVRVTQWHVFVTTFTIHMLGNNFSKGQLFHVCVIRDSDVRNTG